MVTMNVRINDGNLALSEARVDRLLRGDTDGAKAMGLFDRMKDVVLNGGAKQAALNALVDRFEASRPLGALAAFSAISEHVVDKSDLMLDVSPPYSTGMADVRVLVKGSPVAMLQVNHASAAALLGKALPTGAHAALPIMEQANWLDGYKRPDEKATEGIDDKSFSAGGVHKRVALLKGHGATGLLRAEDATGRSDFAREQAMHDLAHEGGREELNRYVSTQRRLEHIPGNLDARGAYAVFDTYDKTKVDSGELDKTLTTLQPDQARSVMRQTVDMLRVFYQNDVSHRDLHMHNLMVYQDKGDPSRITLKAIDFGKSEIGAHLSQSKKFDDLRYMFNKEAIGFGDSMRRTLRESRMNSADRVAVGKHYPLHQLLAQVSLGVGEGLGGLLPRPEPELVDKKGKAIPAEQIALDARTYESARFDDLLAGVGDQLIQDLELAESHPNERAALIDAAFQRAGSVLDEAAARVAVPERFEVPPPGAMMA